MKTLIPSSWLAFCLVLTAMPTAQAADVTAPIDQRFGIDGVDEVPDFQRHVVPLLGKLGCNGRACHGSFQGQGGFRLSLFGYDFKMDHEGLTGGDEPRVNLKNIEESLAIQKPTMAIPHEGGERYEVGSWQHRVFQNWIKNGAQPQPENAARLQKLVVEPAEIVFAAKDEQVQLRATAVWSDGAREDVTTLCRFQTNNSQVATISETGLLTAVDPGDTHVVAFYDVAVVPIPVLRPVSDQVGARFPQVATSTKVDELVVDKLRKLGIVPSEQCTDSEFLRRLSLDLTGTLPTATEVAEFLKDTSPDKRARKIDELLESPGYAAWWTTQLCDITGNNDQELNNVLANNNRTAATQGWYDWIRQRVERNTPYDEMMAGLILGQSREADESFEEFCGFMTKMSNGDEQHALADRDTMPMFWARNSLRRSNEARAISFAYTFMGIRIQCAQCHKHPFDQWTQDDFNEFSNFFAGIGFGVNPETRKEYNSMMEELGLNDIKNGGDRRRKLRELAQEGKVIPFQELYVNRPVARQANPNGGKRRPQRGRGNIPTKAKLLGGDEIDLTQFEDPRQPLVDWLRASDNRFFARSFVNRVWSNYFNVGIVEPADDMSLANPPSNAALLDYLAEQFVAHNFDMKWLHREILNSDTYQRSWRPNETNRSDLANFSHAIPRRLPAEVAYDALQLATAADKVVSDLRDDVSDRAIGFPGVVRNPNGVGYALQVFGRSIRESNCDCDRSTESSLLQTVFLQNDRDVLAMLDQRNSWINELGRELGQQINASNQNAALVKRLETQFETQKRRVEQQLKKARKSDNQRQINQYTRQLKQIEDRYNKNLERLGVKPAADNAEAKADADDNQEDVDALIKQAYLRTLSRYPTDEELQRAGQHVREADRTVEGIRDLMWVLINTKEFIVNH